MFINIRYFLKVGLLLKWLHCLNLLDKLYISVTSSQLLCW